MSWDSFEELPNHLSDVDDRILYALLHSLYYSSAPVEQLQFFDFAFVAANHNLLFSESDVRRLVVYYMQRRISNFIVSVIFVRDTASVVTCVIRLNESIEQRLNLDVQYYCQKCLMELEGCMEEVQKRKMRDVWVCSLNVHMFRYVAFAVQKRAFC